MNHETYHELLALRLYGELSAEEERVLERHLSACDACAAFARELEGTLGALRPRAVGADLPPDWTERLRAVTQVRAPKRRLQQVASFVGGLAAGLLLMASLDFTPDRPPVVETGVTVHTNAGDGPDFAARATPPPHTTSTGTLGRLALLRR